MSDRYRTANFAVRFKQIFLNFEERKNARKAIAKVLSIHPDK